MVAAVGTVGKTVAKARQASWPPLEEDRAAECHLVKVAQVAPEKPRQRPPPTPLSVSARTQAAAVRSVDC